MTTDGVPRFLPFDGLTDSELNDLYAYPESGGRWVRANFVASVDGAVTVGGTVGDLTTPSDQRILTLLRDLADVVLVGASTVRIEGYTGIRTTEQLQAGRLAHGLTPVPPIAVVSGRAGIDPGAALFTDTAVAPIIITSTEAPPDAKAALVEAGADVVEIGSGNLDIAAILEMLAGRGLRRILCEGGPTLLGELIAAELLNELCLTTTPVLVGGKAGRLAMSSRVTTTAMRCQHILVDKDGSQFAKWVARTTDPSV